MDARRSIWSSRLGYRASVSATIVQALCEGCSIRATVRMTGASKNTIAKLLIELGAACSKYQDETFRNLTCRRVQPDEIWSYCYAKNKNVTPEIREKNPEAHYQT